MNEENILYLYAYLAIQGFGHIKCRKLVDTLKGRYVVDLKYAIVSDKTFSKSNESIRRETVPEGDLLSMKYRVLIIEARLGVVDSAKESEKMAASTLRKFIDKGGIVIFLMSDVNSIRNNPIYNAFLKEAGLPAIRNPRSKGEFPDIHLVSGDSFKTDIIFGYDEENALTGGHFFSIKIDEDYLKVVDNNARPAFQGVSQIVVDHPLQLEGYKFLLVGNQESTRMVTSGDLWWDGNPYHVFGVYNDYGRGVSATITGGICLDQFQNYKTDANKLILNLVDLFVKYQNMRSPFLGLYQTVKQIKKDSAEELAQALKKRDPESTYDKISEEISRLVLEKIRKIPEKIGLKAARFAEDKLKEIWEELEDETRIFLISGETFYQQNRLIKPESKLDFSGAIVLFAKAIETELVTKLLEKFRDYLEKSGRSSQLGLEKIRSKTNAVLFDYLFKGREKLSLGQIGFYLRCINSSDPIISELRNFLLESREPNYWILKEAFPKTLGYITVNFRNGSAHDKVMSLKQCEELRGIIFGSEGQESLIVHIFKNIPSTGKERTYRGI